MEVVSLNLQRRASPTGTVGIPFNKRNVEEWSRLDRLTGMMEKAKIETDHWSASTTDGAHKYGKMVDSRERNNRDGSVQQRHHKQMEVFQSQVAGGSMHVIRTQTVSSSSSKWSSSVSKGFEDLQLPINQLDLSSQKTKGSVGRSGSAGTRRPPSRPRSLVGSTTFGDASNLCQRLHEEAKKDLFSNIFDDMFTGSGHVYNGGAEETDSEEDSSGVVITEITNSSDVSSQRNNLSRQKSCSNENITIEEDNDDGNALRRTSKVRRSLQFPKQSSRNEWKYQDSEFCSGKSLKERAAEIENLLRRGSSSNTTASQDSDRSSFSSDKPKQLKTRDSFVTAETLKEVRDRLKKANNEAEDDGIVTESSRVKSFVYGMESLLGGKKPQVNGTGSLGSSKGSSNGGRTAEWYRRRKSYGFEQVDESEKLNQYNKESSTDSGICQSSETVSTPTWINILSEKKPADESYPKLNSTIVNLNNTSDNSTIITVGNEREENRRNMFRRFTNESLSESVWNRKSPLPMQRNSEVRESLKSSLRSAKNPWLSQLRGTKLVDRRWISDESDSDEEAEPVKLTDLDNGGTKKHKKVEFCKTEVHFAAESGKFNIVETDFKPPPSDILKRRRRNSGPFVLKNTSGLPETKFGDSAYEKKLLTGADTTESLSDKIEAELEELSRLVSDTLPVAKEPEQKPTITLPKLYDLEEEDADKPRSILKNYRGSYLLGDPVGSLHNEPASPPVWKSTVILRNKRFDDVQRRNTDNNKLYASDGESELQTRFRSLRKIDPNDGKWQSSAGVRQKTTIEAEMKRRSLPDDILKETSKVMVGSPVLSVAERIKQVEELRSSSYASKINFRSGEMTVVQNGSERINKEIATPDSNPNVTRFSNNQNEKSDSQPYQTTRILINLKTSSSMTPQELQPSRPKPVSHGSWTPGMRKDFTRQCEDLKSTSLVIRTINHSHEQETETIPKSSKPVFEIVNQFDSLSLPRRTTKEKRRRTMPVNYKAPKEYTHADLEEELKNFTDDLDKDFKDIYEQEIGNLNSARKQSKEKEVLMKLVDRSSTSSRGNYETDGEDSDVLADEEVRSYMSTGHGGTDSEEENRTRSIKHPITKQRVKDRRQDVKQHNKIASIALRYEDDPTFSKTSYKSSVQIKDTTDLWEKTSNSSSTYSDSRPRERVSYLSGPSLSEKYSKPFQRGSNSSLDSTTKSHESKQESYVRRSYREEQVYNGNMAAHERSETDSVVLEELTRAADQILQAVNGYTDEDSHLASSDDEEKRRIIRKDRIGSLGTISEGKRVTKTESRRVTAVTQARRGNASSASSLESLEPARSAKQTLSSKLKQKEPNKSLSSRATRLLQRASSREALLAQPSSSEDIPSYVELAKKRTVKRRVSSSSTIKSEGSETKTCTRSKPKQTEPVPSSRTKERKPSVSKEPSSSSRSKLTQQSTTERTSHRRSELSSRRATEKTEAEPKKKRTPLYNREEATNSITKKKTTTSRSSVKRAEPVKSTRVFT